MPSVLRVPTPLRTLTKGEDVLDVPRGTLGEALSQLDALYPGIKDRLVDENGEVRPFINIFVNGDDVTYLQGLHTRIGERDEIDIVPSVAGG